MENENLYIRYTSHFSQMLTLGSEIYNVIYDNFDKALNEKKETNTMKNVLEHWNKERKKQIQWTLKGCALHRPKYKLLCTSFF